MCPAAPNFPFINEGEVAMCLPAPNFPFINEGEVAMCLPAPNFPFITGSGNVSRSPELPLHHGKW